jgi:hypothetical protein
MIFIGTQNQGEGLRKFICTWEDHWTKIRVRECGQTLFILDPNEDKDIRQTVAEKLVADRIVKPDEKYEVNIR